MRRFQFRQFASMISVGILCAAWLAVGGYALGQAPVTPILYYPVLVPYQNPKDWPFEKQELYFAFDRKEFEEIINSSQNSTYNAAQRLRQNAIRSTELFGELKESNSIGGKGVFHVRSSISSSFRQVAQSQKAENSSLSLFFSVPVDPIGFWLTEPTFANGEPIAFGSDGVTSFLKFDESSFLSNADSSGDVEVHFQWSLRARRDHRGNPVFDLVTPNAPQTVWNLKIAKQWTPHISEGFRMEQTEPETAAEPDVSSPKPSTAFRHWKIFPGSRNRTNLTLVSSASGHSLHTDVPIQQTITYNLKPEGLDVKSTMTMYKPSSFGTGESGLSARGRRTPFSQQQPLSGTILLDSPLQLVSVYLGNQPITATLVPELDNTGTRQYYVNIPEGEGRLTVNAFCPIREDQPWNLPRIRFQSQNSYWMETKCDLFVKEPLLISALEPIQATQTTATEYPESTTSWRGTPYSFLYFSPDSQINAELTLASPYITAKTGSAVSWEEDRIQCTMSFDFSDIGQSSKLVELQVKPHWIIDEESIESYPKEGLLFWEGDSSVISPDSSSAPTKSYYIYLKKPTKIRITGTRPIPESEELSLTELVPVRVYRPEKAGNAGKSGPGILKETILGKHLIALSANFPKRLRPVEDTEQRLKTIAVTDPAIGECFFQDTGSLENSTVYLFDSDSSTVRIKSEQRSLRFDSEIHCNLLLQDQELLQTYTFRCTPTGNRIDVFHVHFSQKSSTPWNWTLTGSNRELQCHILTEEERKQWNISTPLDGNVWEILLPTPRSGPFEVTATRSQSIDKPIAVPLPMIPKSTTKEIELVIDSPYITGVDIINSRLKSIPIPAPPSGEYQSIRAAFRYDPQYDEDSQANPALLLRPAGASFHSHALGPQSLPSARSGDASLQKSEPNKISGSTDFQSVLAGKMPAVSGMQTAWTWTLQLDSQFEHNGVVREHATFFIENRGQKQTRILLPPHVPLENVQAVWIGEQRVTWNPSKSDQNNDGTQLQTVRESTKNSTVDLMNNAILLTLPKKQRFPLVSLEYWYHSKPLADRKKIRPMYPEIDMPVLGQNWIAWTPPEFQTFLKEKRNAFPEPNFENFGNFRSFSRSGHGISLKNDPMEKVPFLHSFDPFSRDDWNFFLPSTLRVKECLPVAERLLRVLGNENQVRSMIPPTSATQRGRMFYRDYEFYRSAGLSRQLEQGTFSESGPKYGAQTDSTSGTVEGPTWGEFFSHPKMLAYIFDNSHSVMAPRIYCDWAALRRIGIFPTTPIRFPGKTTSRSAENFASDNSVSGDTVSGNTVLDNAGITILFYDDRSFLITSSISAVKYQQGLRPLLGERTRVILEGPIAARFREILADPMPPFWIKLSAWNARFRDQQHPWGSATCSVQVVSGAIGWNAVELRRSDATSEIYVAHRPTFIALSQLAFLFVVVLSFWKPLSNIVFPGVCAIVFGGLSYFLAPYYAVIPTWAFWGALCSVMFILIRPESVPVRKSVSMIPPGDSMTVHDESTDAEYEVRELRPFGKTEAIRAKRSESFFDKLKSDFSDEE